MNDERELTYRLGLPTLLPQVEDPADQCVARLTEKLLANRGISRVHVAESGAVSVLCMHYDPTILPLERLHQLARTAGAGITTQYRHENLHLLGMGCTDCAASIEHVVGRTEGVVTVSVSYAAERMRVEYDIERISSEAIVSRIRAMGYDVAVTKKEGVLARHGDLLLSLASGLFLAAGFFGGLLGVLPWLLQLGCYVAAYLLGGFDAARHGLRAAIHLEFDIDLLMVVAAAGAAVVGQWAEGALLLFLFSLGHALEHAVLGRARGAIDALAELAPQQALIRREGREYQVATDELLRGDTVIVRPGERIPIDGSVLSGNSGVDESTITGESMPAAKTPGRPVYAGTVNGDGALVIEVTKLRTETMLSRIVTMVKEAQTQKAPTERAIDRFERIFVPVVLVGVVLMALVPPLVGILTLRDAFLRAMTVLVATSPCALAIATPAAVLSAIARAARCGVLIKGGRYLEALGRIRAAAFDKTGTITTGEPRMNDLVCAAGVSSERLLSVAAAAERQSKHPLARALGAEAERRGIEVGTAEEARDSGGRGIRAVVGGFEVLVGSPVFIAEHRVEVPGAIASAADRLHDEGKTAVYVTEAGSLLGCVAFADAPRPEAAAMVRSLRRSGIRHLALLTGDNARVAEAVGREVGIEDRRAELLPDEKVAAIEQMVEHYGPTAMIGDGINDAPAMARSSVSIAMGARGSDVALETADVALMSDDLTMLPFAIGLSRRARRIIVGNLIVAIGVILLLLTASAVGLATIGEAIAVHEGSTLVVVANALRLLGYRGRVHLRGAA